MKILKNRYFILSVIAIILASVIAYKYYDLQVVNGYQNKAFAQSRHTSSVTISAPRGEIKDRNGITMVSNRNQSQIELIRGNATDSQLNDNIFTLVEISIKEGFSYVDEFPVTLYMPFEFTDKHKALSFYKSKISSLIDTINASDFLDKLISYYNVDSKYSLNDARRIIGIRYMIDTTINTPATAYVFKKNADISAVSAVSETLSSNDCIQISNKPERKYVYPYVATHIIGTLGNITEKEYEILSHKGYTTDSLVGKSGIEKAMEHHLKGKDGYINQTYDSDNNITSTETVGYVPGNDIYLTIDINVQKRAEKALAKTVDSIESATGGGVCVLDVTNGEILALASNPTYNLEEYSSYYSELLLDPSTPLFNRAISGTYSPGSVFKMLTAIAALEEGVVTKDKKIKDEGVFKFSDYSPHCWIYDKNATTHGEVNVCDALKVSCNYYFYETALALGIEKLNKYASLFGLCQRVGTELISEEATGYFATPQSLREKGIIWNDGNLLQVAIGESFSQFTPLQLCVYISTLVNGGTRYTPHFVKEIRNNNNEQTLTQSQIADKLDISPESLETVMEGMQSVTEDGTASNVFGPDYPLKVGGKTGTATLSSGAANGVFVAFAPFDSPKIAVSVIIEHGEHGNNAATVAKEIFNEYFKINE